MIATEKFASEMILERFAQALKVGRLAHAYLLIGPKHIGKKQTALAVAKLVNCERAAHATFCDACPACVKITSGMHPDVHVLGQEDDESIKIEDVRDLLSQVQLRAFEARTKVFIIPNVERLTLEAANALLKTLEEPAKNTLILLTTSIPDSVLGTIKSRCQTLYLFPLGRTSLRDRLAAAGQVTQAEAHFLSCLAEGCPGRIPSAEAKAIVQRRNLVIDQFLLTRDDDMYVKDILKDPAQVKEMLHFLFCWFKDISLLKIDVESVHVMNIDRLTDLKVMKERYTFEEIEEIISDIVKTRKALEENFNVKVPLALLKERTWKR
ncbi:MAG TPA: DNA polymerase III subunit delta' [Candidatus Omnitrophota bacterium]|nr:DNA polymerase III subunit delta' [Candidatus Omnitrophota bacterium]HQL40913.1 DNA polymerase III subunit delta' [Candidatus Omnitrophota bacterium]